MKRYKLIFTVPANHTERVLKALWDAGLGTVGNYSHCSFTLRWIGRFLPWPQARPSIGTIGKIEAVLEDQVQIDISENILAEAIRILCEVHPYEEVVYDIFEKEELGKIT